MGFTVLKIKELAGMLSWGTPRQGLCHFLFHLLFSPVPFFPLRSKSLQTLILFSYLTRLWSSCIPLMRTLVPTSTYLVIQDYYCISQIALPILKIYFTSPKDGDLETFLLIPQPTTLCSKVIWLSTWPLVALVLLIDSLPSAPSHSQSVASNASSCFHLIWFENSHF